MTTTVYHPVDPQPEVGQNIAPDGHVWICMTCMNTSRDKHAPVDETWRPCCHNNSVLAVADEAEEGELS